MASLLHESCIANMGVLPSPGLGRPTSSPRSVRATRSEIVLLDDVEGGLDDCCTRPSRHSDGLAIAVRLDAEVLTWLANGLSYSTEVRRTLCERLFGQA